MRQLLPDLASTLPGSLTGLAGFLLGRASRLLRGQREEAMRSLGLEPRCVRMLVPLDSAQPCTQEQLARRRDLTSPTIVQSVDELHDSGLITRDRNPGDRREHVLQLTGVAAALTSAAGGGRWTPVTYSRGSMPVEYVSVQMPP